MDITLVQKFYDRWPKWFKGLTQSPSESCLAFGFECGDGWFDLLWRLCEDIEKLDPPEDFYVDQVKEKYGGLRFYVGNDTLEIYDRIVEAEEESYTICEDCGSVGAVTSNHGWLSTLCDKCRG
jgi:hypothetical protein